MMGDLFYSLLTSTLLAVLFKGTAQEINEEQRCLDGSPAIFACNPSTDNARLSFICEEDQSLGCEQIGEMFFCCAEVLETAFPNTSTKASSMSTSTMTTTSTTSTSSPTTPTSNLTTHQCEDALPQCALNDQLCGSAKYGKLAKIQCRKTCNACQRREEESGEMETTTMDSMPMSTESNSSSQSNMCFDKGTDCERASFLCNKPAYSALMSVECAKTCKRCSSEASTEDSTSGGGEFVDCKDNYRRCPVWKKIGFCASSSYTDTIKRKYCSKTCAYCF